MKTLLFLILLLPCCSFSQDLTEYNKKRLKTDQNLMLGLGSWATVNFVASGIGWATTPEGEARYFHQMNVLWNTVNIGLAIPGLIKARKDNPAIGISESLNAQRKTETIFLFNSGLDIAYISSGLILRSEAKSNLEKRDQFNGFGSGLILQGGFLLVFDMTAYFIHRSHAKKKLSPFMDRLQLSSTGIGLNYQLDGLSYTSIKQRL